MKWIACIYVMAGGAIGSLCRYLMVMAMQRPYTPFPWGTLCVNLIGSFVVGLVWGVLQMYESNHPARLFIMVGLLGGFTTFSAFSLETLLLFKAGAIRNALLYVFSSNLGGFALAYTGYLLVSIKN